MKTRYLLLISLCVLCWSGAPLAFDSKHTDPDLPKPYQQDAYGPGVNSDATGRPFKWQTRDGEDVAPNTKVKPDAYGPDVGMDEYGRPVKGRQR